MKLLNKEVLVLGLGISGLSTIKTLKELGAKISIADSRNEESLKDSLLKIKDIEADKYLGDTFIPLNKFDLIVKSPGIPPRADIFKKAQGSNIKIITDIELGYLLSPTDKIIAITGTNGKTTTTTLVGEIFKNANLTTYIVGNIGVGILEKIPCSREEDVLVIETSSFQLENTISFKPKVSLILNISPDHLDWHGSYEAYIKSKKKIFRNQDINDYTILNYDDKLLRGLEDEIKSKIIWFSLKEKLDNGIYIEDDYIIISDGKNNRKIMSVKDIKVLGKHNLENILGSIGIAYAMGIDLKIAKDSIENFSGVEHRLEFVEEKNKALFYNDSKGTNIEASIKAIQSINTPIILIAGGYDKGIEFDELINSFGHKVKGLIILGQTKEKIKEAAIRKEFKNYHLVDSMEEAVELAYDLSSPGDSILLSPACASWGMYKNFEERGKVFKDLVRGLKEE